MDSLVRRTAVLLLLAASAAVTTALEVTPGSHCAVECMNSPGGNEFSAADSTTTTEEITCRDVEYSTTDARNKFQKCLDCLQSSSKVDRSESDLKWYIYNLRFALGTCLYGIPRPVRNGTVAAQCDLDIACKPLKAPLTDPGFDANPNNTWGYCMEGNGEFMGKNFAPCTSCLQATAGEVYLSNFMTALKAGCIQQPTDGNIISLSGNLFTTSSLNMTDPFSKENGSQSNGTLSPSAITGIAIGVLLIFLLAVSLFIGHFRRENYFFRWDQSRCLDSHSSTDAYSYPTNYMSQACRRYFSGNAFGEKPPPANSTGKCPDRMQAEMQAMPSTLPINQRLNHSVPQNHTSSNVTALNSDGPGHVIASCSRSVGQMTHAPSPSPSPSPSPPTQVHQERRPNTPDSFAIQAYLNTAEESNHIAAQRSSSIPAGQQAQTTSKRASIIPNISIPHVSKMQIPIIFNFAKLFTGQRSSKRGREMVISPPLMTSVPGSHGMPMSGPAVMSKERPPPSLDLNRQDRYIEVPLRSGKSTLYGY